MVTPVLTNQQAQNTQQVQCGHNGALDGGGSIFGTVFARAKLIFRRRENSPDGDPAPAGQRKRWKRALLLAPLLVGLLVLSLFDLGHPAAGKAGKAHKAGLIAALADPLAFFAERSPGERGGGALFSTKPGIAPSERVLSEVRDRDPPAGDPPAADTFAPVTDEDLAAIPGGLPGGSGFPGGAGGAPGGPGFVSPFFAPFIPGGGDPGDPGIVGFVPSPPGGVGAVPEPATWAMMILGFFAVGAALRRRAGQKDKSATRALDGKCPAP